MSRIRSKNTSPEVAVRKALYGLGYRYRLHAQELPGKPDIVMRKRKLAIFVHGCFWHQHTACREGRPPGSNRSYWSPKLTRNVERDTAHMRALELLGWKVLVIWECEVKDKTLLSTQLTNFLK